MNTDYEDRLSFLHSRIPDLWDCDYTHSVPLLYIGANARRMDYIPELYDAGYEITVLEVDPDNLASLADDPRIKHLVLGNVGDVDTLILPHDSYDVVFAWHVIEHLGREEAERTLESLAALADRYLVVGTPWGRVEQGAVGGNEHERHLSYWTPEDFDALGFDNIVIGKQHVLGSCVLAWKEFV
jgi:hypothetical protein